MFLSTKRVWFTYFLFAVDNKVWCIDSFVPIGCSDDRMSSLCIETICESRNIDSIGPNWWGMKVNIVLLRVVFWNCCYRLHGKCKMEVLSRIDCGCITQVHFCSSECWTITRGEKKSVGKARFRRRNEPVLVRPSVNFTLPMTFATMHDASLMSIDVHGVLT